MAVTTAVVVGAYTAREAKMASKDAKAAQDRQENELKRQADIRAKQDKLVAERAATEEASTKERAARLSKGRRGLLYEGTGETGVTTANKQDVLGG